ncbi:preprotein translocase subunit SecA [bacterium]|nr:preprotein translocase subunit SecA [bacterium]
MASIISSIFGTKNDREIKRLRKIAEQIGTLEPDIQSLSDERLQKKTDEFRERLTRGETVEDILPEAFAVVREAAKRALGMRPFDVQLIGGLVLHEGRIAEMKTGEGKTLVATLPVYLNALTGEGVHVVTVNDYLARRDAEWMGRVYRFLGLTVGTIYHGLSDVERREAYACDVTYATNNELGFDYLRDNMKLNPTSFVQRGFHFAVVDEVDSILVDEARTPLIISGATEDSTDKYYVIDRVIPRLGKDEDYTVDEKHRSSILTESGVERVQSALGVENIYDPDQIETLHHVQQALKAHTLFARDKDYVVKDGEVIIVDEFTGRLMPGRRYSDGLHQALEAKEGVTIENETQTLASITFQNFFRMYDKLSGMTGTADTEAVEFKKIYDLDVVVVPTHMPMIREDEADTIYRSAKEKFNAVVRHIKETNEKGQPMLVGTISIEKNEMLSLMLKRAGVPHEILNAKNHGREAEIVAQAGRKGAVTLATNMAGRGTDIVLGGNAKFMAISQWRKDHDDGAVLDEDSGEYKAILAEKKKLCDAEREEVLKLGGLYVIGTERHESRRIDNQLRGRSGRQGDPGASVFYLALDDDLMRIFGSERMDSMLARLGVKEDEPIFHPWISKAIENAQKKVEGHNFDIRKRLLEYDDVMNKQREVVYEQRRRVLTGEDLAEEYLGAIEDIASGQVAEFIDEKTYPEEWPWEELREVFRSRFGAELPAYDEEARLGMTPEAVREDAIAAVKAAYQAKEREVGETIMRDAERFFLLTTIDVNWKDHLLNMDHLRDGIGLRGYGQINPLLAYKKEGFDMFEDMGNRIREQALEKILRFEVKEPDEQMFQRRRRAPARPLSYGREALVRQQAREATPEKSKGVTVRRAAAKVGPNDPCPCGSGKKYKKCCRDKDKAAGLAV